MKLYSTSSFIKLFFIAFLFIVSSCSTMNRGVYKNNKLTNSMTKRLSEKNGNTFYIKLPRSNFSKVWSYSRDSIDIFTLSKGKITPSAKYKTNHNYTFEKLSDEELSGIKECVVEYGFFWGYRVGKKKMFETCEFCLSPECFLRKEYKTDLLNGLIKDITIFDIWKL